MTTASPASDEAGALLVERIRAGDATAEEEFARLYRKRVLLVSSARTHDREAALDITQEVLVAVLKALRAGQIRESHKLAAFVQGTARNLINNFLRTRARRSEFELDSANIPLHDAIEEVESADRRSLIQRELRRYSIQDQQILLFSIVDGHSLAEIAQRLNLSHDAVRARKSRLIRKITKKIARLSQK
jgi:RNA polymerase sigma factor (sigma-70 family)